jgi:hypothetical protein
MSAMHAMMTTEWYYQLMNEIVGPLSPSELVEKIRAGQVKEDTLIRKDDSQWVSASQVNGLFEAAQRNESRLICPYCGHDVDRPPTTCKHCNRQLVMSVSSRMTSKGFKKKPKKVARDREAEKKAAQKHNDRVDIARYLALLILWFGLLFVAPYLTYLATTGQLVFEGELAVFSFIAVSAVVGVVYWLISKFA